MSRVIKIIIRPTYIVITWPVTAANRKRLEVFHHNCLRRILNITWKEVKNDCVRRKTGQPLLECYTLQKEGLDGLIMYSEWKMSVALGKRYIIGAIVAVW